MELEEVILDQEVTSKVVKIGRNLNAEQKKNLFEFLRNNLDVFAWSHVDMVGISPKVIMHTLILDRDIPSKQQKTRLLGNEKG